MSAEGVGPLRDWFKTLVRDVNPKDVRPSAPGRGVAPQPVRSGPQLKVFLCHASEDKSAVQELDARLSAAGVDVWFDERLIPGEDWELEIETNVRECDVVVVVVSARSATKLGYVQRELRLVLDVALEQPYDSIYLIPLMLDDSPIPSALRKWHAVRTEDPSWYERLIRSLQKRSDQLGRRPVLSSKVNPAPVTARRPKRLDNPTPNPTVAGSMLESHLPSIVEPSCPIRLLLVDDAPELGLMLEPLFSRVGFDVKMVGEGGGAIELARSFEPDVIVLDLLLPGIDGLEVCRRIRHFSDAYIVMVSAMDTEIDRIVGLSTGADDYVTKPFSPNEIVARVRAMLRRPRHDRTKNVVDLVNTTRAFGPLTIDTATRQVLVRDAPAALTRVEFDLLSTLCSRPQLIFTRGQLIDMVGRHDWLARPQIVDRHVSNLRRKLGDHDRSITYIHTVRGVGYRLSNDLVESKTHARIDVTFAGQAGKQS